MTWSGRTTGRSATPEVITDNPNRHRCRCHHTTPNTHQDQTKLRGIDAKLSLIHVKGADTTGLKRKVAVGPYEVVASQAAKNARYLSPSTLRKALENPRIERPACWTNGAPVPDRAEFLEMLSYRRSVDPNDVVIIQPHVSELLHTQVRNDRERDMDHSHGVLRMSLLEALLNTARSAIVGSGSDLYVWGAKL